MSAKYPLFGLLVMWLCVSPPLSAAPAIDHWTTPKDIAIYHVPTQGLPLVDVRVVFDAGSARDERQFGLAAMTSALLDTGAADWNADAIASRLDGVGAQLGTGVSRDMAWLSLRSLTLPDKLAVALETAEAILTHPRFEQTDFERERQRALVAIQQRGESPDELADIAFNRLLYGDHPYAHPEEGFTETLTALSRDDLIRFHQQYYTRRNALVVVVGDVSRAEAETMAERLVGGLPVGEVPPALTEPPAKTAAASEKTPYPSEQTHVLIGTLGLKVNDPDYFPLYVGNHILGGSGLVSLISEEIREKRGLSYSAHSYFYPHREAGPWIVGLQTRNEKAGEALQVALDTVSGFIQRGPSTTELEAAKQNIVGGFVLRLDSNQKLTEQVAGIAFYRRPLDYLSTYTAKVNAVTREDIRQAFARRIDPAKLQTILVGGGAKP